MAPQAVCQGHKLGLSVWSGTGQGQEGRMRSLRPVQTLKDKQDPHPPPTGSLKSPALVSS